ncbi:MAG: tRNA pseudouridine(55) synthase TruB [Bacteroidales bacterium]
MYSEKLTIFEEGQVLLFDKPQGWTSFDLVNKIRIMIRSELGIKKIKVGHAGTLDPLATGLMILLTGRATRRTDEFKDSDKEYVASFYLGKTTPSFDLETETNGTYPTDHITRELVEEKLGLFRGEQMQVPPAFSAKFVDGRRAYKFARKGDNIELEPVKVNIKELELVGFNMPEVTVRVLCSKGTYIRSLARDLGIALGSGAYVSSLVRTAIGTYRLDDSMTLEKFNFFLKQTKQT